jgi:CheY-like chemotaxis protein
MPLILAVEPDRHQASQLTAIARGRLHAELVIEATAERALAALGDRVPDLILTAALLSPKDEAALADRLRALDSAAAHIPTITIPVLAAPRSRPRLGGMLSALRREKPQASEVDGCDPAVFAEQCATYLERAIAERKELAATDETRGGEETTPPAQTAGAVDDSSGTAVGTPQAEDLADFDELMLFEQIDDEPMLEQPRDASIVEHVGDEPIFEQEPDLPVLEAMTAEPCERVVEEPAVEQRIDDAVAETIEEASADVPDSTPAVGSIGEPDEALDEALAELEVVAEPVGEDIADAAATLDVSAEELDGDHLLGDSPVFELVTETDAGGNAGGDLESEDDLDQYIELDLSEFLDQPNLAAIVASGSPEPGETPVAARDLNQAAETEPATERIELAAPKPEAEPAEADEADWLEVVAALRRDVERLDAAPVAAKMPKPLKKPGRKALKGKPVQDEWGFFDPEQCGFAALLAKLDEVTATDDPKRRRKRA